MTQFRVYGLLLVLLVAVVGWVLTCGAWRLEQQVALVGPLDTRQFAQMTVVTVGTGGAYENPDRRGPSTAIALGEDVVLVDAGRAVAAALRLSKIPVSQPGTVFLTSLLPENTLGLSDLLITGWLNGRAQPLRVVGPSGTRALTDALTAGYRLGIQARAGGLGIESESPSFEVEEISGGWSGQIGGLAVRAEALPGGPIEALAYRFESEGRSAVIAATGGWAPDAVVDLARGANLLSHEAVFVPTPEIAGEMGYDAPPEQLEREASEHTALAAVGALAKRAGVQTLVLVRLRPPPVLDLQITSVVDDTFDGRIVIASDGDEITP